MKRMQISLALLVLPALILSACSFRTGKTSPATQASPSTIVPAGQTPAAPSSPGGIETLPDGGARLSTNDGLILTLDAAGQVTALTLNGVAQPITPSLPLVIRDLTDANAPDAPNLLANPGFEDGDAGWSPMLVKGVTLEVASDAAHAGTNALALRGENGSAGAVISDPVPVAPGKRYRVSGHFQVEFGYVNFAGPPTIWQDTLYRGSQTPTGLYLQWLDAAGQPLEASPQLAAPLHWNAQDWHKVTREVTAPPKAASVQVIAGARPVEGAVWIDDLAFVESPEADQPLAGALEIAADRVIQRGEVAGLQVSVSYRPYGDHIAVTTTVTDPSGGPRALDVGWGLPLTAEGWTWWDGLRESRPVIAGLDFARAVSADITGYLPISLYPYAALENGQASLSLAIPLDSPRYVLLHYDGESGRYEGRAHLGISPRATKLNDSADFTLLLYQSDPAWGLRAAAEKHAAIGPDWYDTPGEAGDFTDFAQDHFSASGKGGQTLRAYNEANVYAAQYTVFELNAKIADKDAPRPTYAQALEYIQSQSGSENIQQATFSASVVCDSAGEAHLKSVNVYPWAARYWSSIWIANVDPDVAGGYGQALLNKLGDLFTETAQAGLTINGVEIDNFISVTTVDLCPEHIAAADLPLTYDPNTYQPGVHVASAAWEYLVQLRALLDAQPEPYRGISVNFWGLNIPNLLSPFIDGFAGEGKVATAGASNWTPPILDYRRATAMTRLRMFSIQEPDLTRSQVETAAHEAIFYATQVGRGPHAANWSSELEDILAWANTQSKPLAALGWQPIPYASTDQPDVWVERYGTQAFAVHNWGDAPLDFTLTIDLSAIGQSAEGLLATESISGENVSITIASDGSIQISGRLEPGRTAVYWLGK
ncbi:MAG: hypothetical protein GXP40_02700 [Chloroflexi bacterium]|nr:hypothetical protein [Chloroflexota bacterium]